MSYSFEKILSSEKITNDLAAALAKNLSDGGFIYLRGDLGVGKTTLVRGVLQALGYLGKVKSPTYTLIESYQIGATMLFHFDLYRIKNAEELFQLGIEEYFTATSICFVEWPENGGDRLPTPDVMAILHFTNNERIIQLTAHTQRGERILRDLS